jgi:hypothetical protein
MLTLDDIIKVGKMNQKLGLTGKHVFGRGHQRTDGTFSDERPRRGKSILEKKYPLVEDKPKTPKP